MIATSSRRILDAAGFANALGDTGLGRVILELEFPERNVGRAYDAVSVSSSANGSNSRELVGHPQ